MPKLLAVALFLAGLYLWVPRVVAYYGRTFFDDPKAKPGRLKLLALSIPLGTLLRFAALFYPAPALPFVALMLVALAGVILADAKFQVIPDRFQMVGAIGAAGFAYHTGAGPLEPRLVAVGVGLFMVAGLYGLTRLYTLVRQRDALGLGDVKLLAWLSLAFGPDTFFVLVYGLLLALLAVMPLLVFRRKSMHSFFAFGPFLAAAAVLRLVEMTLVR